MSLILKMTAENGTQVYGFAFTGEKGAKMFQSRWDILVEDPYDQIEAGNLTQEELDCTCLILSAAHPKTMVLRAPLSVLEVIEVMCGDQAHDAYANSREVKRDPGRKQLSPGYLADARLWSAMELNAMQAIARIKGCEL